MIGLHLIQRRQSANLAADKHATDRRCNEIKQQQQPGNSKQQKQQLQQQQHEQVFRANLVRIPSKVGSPMVNLSQYAQQQQQQQQQQATQKQRRRRQDARTAELLPGQVVEAVAGRSIMIAEPVQRLAAASDCRSTGHESNVLLLIDEHSGEAPIVIGQQRVPGGRPERPVGVSKTREQLEMLCAAADYTTIGGQQQSMADETRAPKGAIVLAPVVVGRRSHRMNLQQRHQQQQQVQYLFGECAPQLGPGVELRQHVLRPIGVVEQILPTSTGGPMKYIDSGNSRFVNVSSDGSRRSTSSSSSSSAASSSNSEQRKQRASQLNQSHLRQQHLLHDSQLVSDAEYTLYEGGRFGIVPEYGIADHPVDNREQQKQGSNKRSSKSGMPVSSSAKSGKKGKQQPLLLARGPISNGPNLQAQTICCDRSSTLSYCCSDPNCQFSSSPQQNVKNYPEKPENIRPLMRPLSCQNIGPPTPCLAACCNASPTNHPIDHHFCHANGHSHPDYLPPLKGLASKHQQRPALMNGKSASSSNRRGYLPRTALDSSSSLSSPHLSQTSDLGHEMTRPTSAEEQMYESLAAELKAKLGNPQTGPILLPPRDYDTLCRKQGKLDGIEQRRSTNPQLVGPIPPEGLAKKVTNDSGSSGNSSLRFNILCYETHPSLK